MNTPHAASNASAGILPFRLDAARRSEQLRRFHRRAEIDWFGFEGAFEVPGLAVVRMGRVHRGQLGGGGAHALNGGVICSGFDAAFVLASLGHFDAEVMVTLELATRFLSLARIDRPFQFRAGVVRSSRSLAFTQGIVASEDGEVFATATGMLAPKALGWESTRFTRPSGSA